MTTGQATAGATVNLVEQATAYDRAERRKVYNRYCQLLTAGSGTTGEAAELRSIMDRLGITAEQLRDDSRTVQRARQMEDRIRNGTGLRDKLQDMSAAVLASQAEMERTVAELRRKPSAARLGDERNRRACR
jgi:hypothetical protein